MAGTPRATSRLIGPPGGGREAQRARQREALEKLLGSSTADCTKFGTALAELERASVDAAERHRTFREKLAGAGRAAAAVRESMTEALTVSEHTTEDMSEATEKARRAVDVHRAAHRALEESDLGLPDIALSDAAQLREAAAEARRQVRQAEKVMADARRRMASAASAVQMAVGASRREAPKAAPPLRPA